MEVKNTNDRLIRLKDNLIEITPSFALPLTCTNLPLDAIMFTNRSFYWQIRIEAYDSETAKITIRVIDYFPAETEGFQEQKIKRKVHAIEFQKLEWQYLPHFLISYKKDKLRNYIIDSEIAVKPDRSQREIAVSFRVKISDLRFENGSVHCDYFFAEKNKDIELSIKNDYIIPAFGYIRNYFSKAFGRKTIDVHALIKMSGKKMISVEASSPQISSIDDRLIKTIKMEKIVRLTTKPKIMIVDKSVFTANEAFEAFTEGEESNPFNHNVADIIQLLAKAGIVRNRKQLEYLSGKKHNTDTEIRMTLKPHFGFLFCVKTESAFYFCWELLNSHATYIWRFEKSNQSPTHFWQILENQINQIRSIGREQYIDAYCQAFDRKDFTFFRIFHKKASSAIDHFPNWKSRLEEAIV